MDKLLENIRSKYLPNASASETAQSSTSQTNSSGGDALLSDIRSRYGVTNNTFVPGTAKSEVVVAEKEKPTAGNRLGNVVSGALKTSAGQYAGAARAQYEAGQGGRTQRDVEQMKEMQWAVAKAKADYDSAVAAGQSPGMVQASKNELDTYTTRLKAYADVLGEGVYDTALAQANAAALGLGRGESADALYKSLGNIELPAEGGIQQKATKATSQLVNEINASAQEDIGAAKEGLGATGQFLVDYGVGATQLVADAAANIVAPGMSQAALVQRVFGGAAHQAEQAGASLGKQFAYGTAAAALELALEKISGSLDLIYGEGFADEVVENLVNKIAKSSSAKTALHLIANSAGESLEEFASAIISPALESIYNGKKVGENYDKDTLANAFYDALLGGALGLGGGAVNVAGTSAINAINNRTSSNSSQTETANTDNATAESTTGESGAEAIVEPATEQSRDALETVLLDSVSPTARQINEIAKDPAQLERLGIDPNGKTASQLRAEVREALSPKTAAPVAETAAPVQQNVEQTPVQTQPIVAEQEITPQSVNSPVETASESANAGNAVGAARQGFDPFTALQNKYGTLPSGENPVRPDDVPVSTNGRNRVHQSVVTLKGAKGLPDARIEQIERDVLAGNLSYLPDTNEAQAKRALRRIREKGFQAALSDWKAAVNADKVTADLVAEGAILQVAAANSDMPETEYLDLVGDYIKLANNGAAATQANRILKTLSPHQRLYIIKRDVQRMNDRTAETFVNEKGEEETKYRNRPSGVPTWLWMDRVGEGLSRRLVGAVTAEQVQEASTVSRTIMDDLFNFAMQDTPLGKELAQKRKAKQTIPPRKRIDRLIDLFHNPDKYREAWNVARNSIIDKYGEDEAIMSALDSWLNTFLEETGPITKLLTGRDDVELDPDLIYEYVEATTDERRDEIAAKIDKIVKKHIEKLREAEQDAENHNLPTWLWMDEVGNALATRLVNAAKSKPKQKADTVSQAVLDDLYHFAMKETPFGKSLREKNKTTHRTSKSDIERFSDLFQNPGKYREAWNAARNTIIEKYGNDEDVMDALDSWMNSFLDESGSKSLLTKQLLGENSPIEIPDVLVGEYLAAETEEQRDEALVKIAASVARQTTGTVEQQFNAWRNIMMLGNFKTIERNFFGNVGLMGVRAAHNAVGATLERMFKTERTRSVTVSEEWMDAARNYYEDKTVKAEALGDNKYTIKSASSYFDRLVEEQRRPFGYENGKAVHDFFVAVANGAYDVVSWAMNNKRVGDEGFNRHAFARMFAGYMKAKGVTVEQFNDPEWRAENENLVSAARKFAADEAQEATFRNNSTLAKILKNLQYRGDATPLGKAYNFMLKGIQPYINTPANITTLAVEYSPVGLLKSLGDAAHKGISKTKLSEKGGRLGDFARKGDKLSGAEIVNELAKGMTGFSIFALGMLLRNMGWLRGSSDDDEKQAAFDDLTGVQEYAFELPDGTSITFDWFTPTSVPLFAGAELMDSINEHGFSLKAVWQALMSGTEVLLNSSVLQGTEDALQQVRYSDDASLPKIAANGMLNYFLQGLNWSMLGQISRAADGVDTMTYVDRDSKVPDVLQKTIGSFARKTPFMDTYQIPYIDAWGRTEEGDFMTRLVNNMFNPAFTSKIEVDPVEQKLQTLYDAVGHKERITILPTRAEKHFKVDGKEYYLSADEYVKYATAKGQYSYELVSEAVNSNAYKNMDNLQRAELITKLYEYANYTAKQNVASVYDEEYAKAANAEKVMSPVEYFVMKQTYNFDGIGNAPSQEEAQLYLDNYTNLTRDEKAYMWPIINKGWKTNPYD